MGSGFSPWSITLCFLLAVLMCAQDSNARRETKWKQEDRDKSEKLSDASDGHDQWINIGKHGGDHNDHHAKHIENEEHDSKQLALDGPILISKQAHDHSKSSQSDDMDPSQHIFFTIDDLKIGKSIPIYFSYKDSTNSYLLSRKEANSIPFSSAQLPYLLEFFSFSKDSPQAKAMEYTLKHCELEPIKGEIRFCATSLESMLDSTRGIFGLNTNFKLLTTSSLTKPTPFQNYTILEVPQEIFAPKVIACHPMPYPYAVFYCHGQQREKKLFEISLAGANGEKVQAAALCHMDTSQWDADHVAFRMLKIKPGASSVCHIFPADNLVWVPVHS